MESTFYLMSPEAEAMEDELGASYGDPRVCPHHPHVQTSSADGMFDAPRGECEWECEMAYQEVSDAPVPVSCEIVSEVSACDDDCPF
jgi:hypothetical protein